MLRFLQVLILSVLLCSALTATTLKECQDKMAACAKANNCAKKPDSRECKACKASYDKCIADAPETRASKKTTKR